MPLSKNPPTNPASMMIGCFTSACHTPRSPTAELWLSTALGRAGMSRLLASPLTMTATTTHMAVLLSGPTQTSTAGPMMKVVPTMVSNSPM